MSTVERLTSWEIGREPYNSLPPDLTRGAMCGGTWGEWGCTRRAGHTGRHAAGTGKHIVAVWASEDQRDSEVTS